ncbi:MAG TPA: VIT family protein [Candidatus Corynebacterium avicola]|uniref:VIT family protein n=1 Tax=Candidatus Corynebacterium avicola TaxID=2838527 RepID=A0A9D1ULP5_9CORY|nr:VIT family protein [Candidatus Corynebacterium avicola]
MGTQEDHSTPVPPHTGEEHGRAVGSKLNMLRAGVLGANDGIVSISAMMLAMIAAGAAAPTVMTAGVASTVAGAVSMALGEYVSVSAQRDTERTMIDQEARELREMPEEEREEMSQILQSYGIGKSTADRAAQEISDKDPLAAHLQLELGLDSEELTSPWAAAGTSAMAFVLGAMLPILSVLFATEAKGALILILVTLGTLALTGALSAKLAGNPVRRSTVRLLIGGALGLTLTYGIGSLFDV